MCVPTCVPGWTNRTSSCEFLICSRIEIFEFYFAHELTNLNCCLHVCSSFLPFEFAKLIGTGDPETTFAKSKIPPIVEQDLVLDYLPSRYASGENPGFGKCIGFVLHSF